MHAPGDGPSRGGAKGIKLSILGLLLVAACTESPARPSEPASRQDGAVQVAIQAAGSLQNPAWSPDGTALLVTRFRNGYNEGPADLLLVDLPGGGTHLLVADGSVNVSAPGASWNGPTGSIVFSADREPHDEIYVIGADGSGGDERRVTARRDAAAYEPTFSPDGSRVAFESHPVDVEGHGVILGTALTGNGPYLALSGGSQDCRQPNWSPAGGLIVCQCLAGAGWDLWLLGEDGGRVRPLTEAAGDETDASFSPDGRWVVFSHEVPGDDFANLYRVAVEGGAFVRITRFEGYDGAPSWSPDGRRIAFESVAGDPDDSGGTAIWVIDLP